MYHETLHGTKVKIWRDSRVKKEIRRNNNLLIVVQEPTYYNVSNISYIPMIEYTNNIA